MRGGGGMVSLWPGGRRAGLRFEQPSITWLRVYGLYNANHLWLELDHVEIVYGRLKSIPASTLYCNQACLCRNVVCVWDWWPHAAGLMVYLTHPSRVFCHTNMIHSVFILVRDKRPSTWSEILANLSGHFLHPLVARLNQSNGHCQAGGRERRD